jgi:hypothetical protein
LSLSRSAQRLSLLAKILASRASAGREFIPAL